MNQKKYKKIPHLPFLLGLGALFLIVLLISIFINRNPLAGKWNMDDVTVYEFGSDHKGALVLPSAEYEFSYKIKENILYIDFVSDKAKDASYTYQIQGDTLTLEGGNETIQGTYVLKKVK